MAWVIVGVLALIGLGLTAGPFLFPPGELPDEERDSSRSGSYRQEVEEDYLLGKLDSKSYIEAIEDKEETP